jgi:hypothetical protein
MSVGPSSGTGCGTTQSAEFRKDGFAHLAREHFMSVGRSSGTAPPPELEP